MRTLTIKGENRILEINQRLRRLRKTYFWLKNPGGLKISKSAANGVTKGKNDTVQILFFTRVPEKSEKSLRFEKIAGEPRQGAGTEGQSRSTKIPVRGLKQTHRAFEKIPFFLVAEPKYP